MDWKARLKEEYRELHNRREELLIFLGGEEYRKLDPRDQEALEAQHDVMRAYEGILWRRLQRTGE